MGFSDADYNSSRGMGDPASDRVAMLRTLTRPFPEGEEKIAPGSDPFVHFHQVRASGTLALQS